jgi:23S rRNA pseudouridine2605 synthase
MAKQRIQKWLSSTGLLSRRKAEEALQSGRIQVNGKTVTELGTQIDPDIDVIELDGKKVAFNSAKTTLAFYKPKGVITSLFDPEGRPIIADYLPESLKKLRPIGRLDFMSEGLILLTNDGELANQIAHPRYEIEKEYLVTIEGRLDESSQKKLKYGIELEDGLGRFKELKILKHLPNQTVVSVIIAEGRNRFIRRMFQAIGHPVTRLVRIRIGGLKIEALKPGHHKSLSASEIQKIFKKN